jgi:signal peptidase I
MAMKIKAKLEGLMSGKKTSGWSETLRTIVYAVLIALVVRTFAYEPFNIPSSSMVPTLLVGDYLFVSKFSYGYSRYSLPFGLPLISERFLADQPERGDVIVFKLPKDNETDYIQRLIGLPGDRIQVKGGVLHINGAPVQREILSSDETPRYAGQSAVAKLYMETLPNGRRHLIRELGDDRHYDNTGVFLVPPGQYFFMGDNRDQSEDSRASVGYVPFQNLVGRAEFLFFSQNGEASFWQIWRWPTTIRWRRLFDGIV